MNHDDLTRKKVFSLQFFNLIKYSYTGDTVCRSHPLRSKNARPLGCVHPRASSCSQPHRRAVPTTSSRPVQSGAVCVQLQSLQQQSRRSARRAREGKKLPSFFSEPLHPRGAASFFRSEHCQKL